MTLISAPDQLVAEMWSDLLNRRGIPTLVRAGDTASFLGVSSYPCRILVDEARMEDALRVLREDFGVAIDCDD